MSLGDTFIPQILIAHANGRRETILDLNEEIREIEKGLKDAVREEYIETKILGASRFSDIIEQLRVKQDRVAILHFSGHSGDLGIEFRPEKGKGDTFISPQKLAKILGHFKGIKLVFLNGCATKVFVEALLDAGIPAVIATQRKVNDLQAIKVAQEFYKTLGNIHARSPYSIQDAFELTLKICDWEPTPYQLKGYRGFVRVETLKEEQASEKHFPWGLYYRENDLSGVEWILPNPQNKEPLRSWKNIRWIQALLGIALIALVGFSVNYFTREQKLGEKPVDFVHDSTESDIPQVVDASSDSTPMKIITNQYKPSRSTKGKSETQDIKPQNQKDSLDSKPLSPPISNPPPKVEYIQWQGQYSKGDGIPVYASVGGIFYRDTTHDGGFFSFLIPSNHKGDEAKVCFGGPGKCYTFDVGTPLNQ